MRIPFISPRRKGSTPKFENHPAPPPPAVVETASSVIQMPDKVYIEPLEDGTREWSPTEPPILDRFYDVLHGYYGHQNLIQLFYCLPEVFAPIHELASLIADANWQLCKDWNDEVDYKNETFNRLFQQANPLVTTKQLIYQAVCYEILTGRQFFYKNRPATLMDEFENVLTWSNLPAQDVKTTMKQVDYYSATELGEFVQKYECPGVNGKTRLFEIENIMPVAHFDLTKPFDINCTKPLILGAEKAIRNLLAVYEARHIIYIEQGQLGFIVSKKQDESGPKSLTKSEILQLEEETRKDYGITRGRRPLRIAKAPIEFIQTVMSIKELMPFEETLADAVAIYKTLRLPRHLVPSKDTSTFSNADSDMKTCYGQVVIPWARRYAQLFSSGFHLKNIRRYINPSYDHIELLQANKKEEADVDKTKTETTKLQYDMGVITKNERNAKLGFASVPEGDTYVGDTDNPDPLAVKLGVGGVQALQSILSSATMDEDAKLNSLVILFGIKEEDAAKMVTTNVETNNNGKDPNNPSEGPNPPAGGQGN